MALSQDERIAISKKLVNIPKENATAESLKGQLDEQIVEGTKADNGNKALQDDQTTLINAYQSELQRYDGDGKTQVSEQDMLDSADRVLQNPFFPNDLETPLPNVPDGVWKLFVPFSGNKAIGKNYDETYTPVQKEQDLIDAVNTAIADVESYNDATRSTGDECTSGSCSLPEYTTEPTCTGNGGVWDNTEFLGSSAGMQQAATDLKNAIQAWEDFLNGTDAAVPTIDTDPTRSAQNTASKADITNAISVIDTWQALQDFDTTTSVSSACATFNAYPPSHFDPSKFRSTELQAIKDEITARQSFITSRTSEINTNLGSVTQDFSTGEITAATGFYGTRFRIIDMRLNAMAGTLSKLRGIERGKNAQQELQNSNDNAELALSTVMSASAFRAPATNTSTIHVLDGSLFSALDTAYVVSENQQEISVVIQSVSNNTIVLDKKIPEKYRHTEGARLYKVL